MVETINPLMINENLEIVEKRTPISMKSCNIRGNEGRFRGVIVNGTTEVHGCVNLDGGLCDGITPCVFKVVVDPEKDLEKRSRGKPVIKK